IKLASNENPLGPSKKAVAAISVALNTLHRYPDGSNYYLKEVLAERLSISTDALIFGNGSNEIIELLFRTFCSVGSEIVMGEPSFAVYPLISQAAGAVAVPVPLDSDFRHDLDAMAAAITDKTRIVFIANPNNPTGTIVEKAAFSAFMDKVPDGVIVVMDEAYCEYVTSAEYPDSIEYVKSGAPVVVLRTFSKIYGLAGLRVGYGIANPTLVGYMDRVRQPFNVNALAQAAALGALGDDAHLEASVKNNTEGFLFLEGELKKLGLEVVPTEANFFLIKVGDGKGVYDGLLKQGVIVRPMASYGLCEYIRVTIGLPEENSRFIEALKSVIS
ncbi:MAG: histidinol-phosphate transaminase, partial [Proteobacteria bacterium]|nr:histidinol-phosphate transaminase [Pseudomonadota bacterium]